MSHGLDEPIPGAPAAVPGLPPEISGWLSAGAAGLQQLIPPNLLPPGLLPGTAGAAALPAADTTPRFHDFRILSQTQVLDADLKETLGKLLGDKA